MSGYMAALGDKWSYYLNKELFTKYLNDRATVFSSVGFTLLFDEESGNLKIMEVYKDSSADRAGLKPFDMVVEVEGSAISDLGFEAAKTRIKGEAGETVRMKIQRGAEEPFDVTFKREATQKQSVYASILDQDIGYIRVSEFDIDTHKAFKIEVEKMVASNMKGIVIDMRFNPGGELDSLLPMMDLLLDGEVIFVQSDKMGNRKEDTAGAGMVDTPIVILLNEYSYSEAEYFAAVMQEYGRAKIVGMQTTGRSFGQQSIPLADGSGIVLSTIRYYTPGGKRLSEKGVTPDYMVEMPEDDMVNFATLPRSKDGQLNRAISVLQAQVGIPVHSITSGN